MITKSSASGLALDTSVDVLVSYEPLLSLSAIQVIDSNKVSRLFELSSLPRSEALHVPPAFIALGLQIITSAGSSPIVFGLLSAELSLFKSFKPDAKFISPTLNAAPLKFTE
ncbi:hypothetical protein [Candidatus Pelagibacter sp. HIMB1623]|uniref:hypothetical protein n=1 Tax=Candidatus Pelagibacter sp. HIMB1623 TaxID=3413358 RepID=UPI003F83FBA2